MLLPERATPHGHAWKERPPLKDPSSGIRARQSISNTALQAFYKQNSFGKKSYQLFSYNSRHGSWLVPGFGKETVLAIGYLILGFTSDMSLKHSRFYFRNIHSVSKLTRSTHSLGDSSIETRAEFLNPIQNMEVATNQREIHHMHTCPRFSPYWNNACRE